jgi:hypothetical protein
MNEPEDGFDYEDDDELFNLDNAKRINHDVSPASSPRWEILKVGREKELYDPGSEQGMELSMKLQYLLELEQMLKLIDIGKDPRDFMNGSDL